MSNELVTVDLSEFGYRELKLAIDLLNLYKDGIFYNDQNDLGDGITINFNKNSGSVFLSDESYIVYMENKGKLERWLYCGECGYEDYESNISTQFNSKTKCPNCGKRGSIFH